jgi:cell division protein FtsZ
MGIGSSRGDDRAVAAAEMAISSPLLEASIDGAHGVLLSIQGGSDLGLFEINEAAQLVANSAAVDANIIFGAVIDDALGDEVRVTVIAAGFDEQRPGRAAAAPVVAVAEGRSPAAQPAGANGAVNGSGNQANGGAPAGPPTTTSWAGNGNTAAGRGLDDNSPASRPPASATADSAASNPGAAAPATASPAGTPSASGTWSVPSTSFSSSSFSSGGAGYTASAGADVPAADPIAEVPVQPASDGSYVPSPVSFVSEDDEDYGSKPGYGGYDRERGGDAAGGPGQVGAGPGWKDSGRAGKQDKVFDVTPGRRRPVVFEEEDDLDVPDFLK